jgi:hypothetical protein
VIPRYELTIPDRLDTRSSEGNAPAKLSRRRLPRPFHFHLHSTCVEDTTELSPEELKLRGREAK